MVESQQNAARAVPHRTFADIPAASSLSSRQQRLKQHLEGAQRLPAVGDIGPEKNQLTVARPGDHRGRLARQQFLIYCLARHQRVCRSVVRERHRALASDLESL